MIVNHDGVLRADILIEGEVIRYEVFLLPEFAGKLERTSRQLKEYKLLTHKGIMFSLEALTRTVVWSTRLMEFLLPKTLKEDQWLHCVEEQQRLVSNRKTAIDLMTIV